MTRTCETKMKCSHTKHSNSPSNLPDSLAQEFDVLAEKQLSSRPDLVVPSRQLPAEEGGTAVHAASVSWRGDGKFFATISHASPGQHQLPR